MSFPISGEASTYSDYFKGRLTANGDIYSHDAYTAALLPRSHWYSLPMGTRLGLLYMGRTVVVKVNDRGEGKIVDGKADERRVLDLSRAAMAYLKGMPASSITDSNAGVIQLTDIRIMPQNTALGPVKR
jgi:rare lipoprotein A